MYSWYLHGSIKSENAILHVSLNKFNYENESERYIKELTKNNLSYLLVIFKKFLTLTSIKGKLKYKMYNA